ncbi:DinB family protein [Flagellimonas sp. S3867]|uniref:DinB family protein n=1 Tax=Flagellimonas sp. S3867 TaxID=2768063 RepID=UPI0016890F72|nr:DinB family protein [Flagellimonas sp. S3867]
MSITEVINELDRNRKVFHEMLYGLPPDFVSWKSNPKGWCTLEIVCHLIDEEVKDFRARVIHALEYPEKPLVPIDPPGWAITNKYLEQDFEASVKKWHHERQKSIEWLKELSNPNWESAVEHPDLGYLTARSFLYNWLAHDYHHIRQINNLRYSYHKENSGDPLTYAGKW